MRIVATSDVHGNLTKLEIPDGDVLILAGDILADYDYGFSWSQAKTKADADRMQWEELQKLNEFLSTLPHKVKILVGGNHDYALEKMGKAEVKKALTNGVYLQDEELIYEGIRFYGYPWVPNLKGMAFYAEGFWRNKWTNDIPRGTDVVVSHGPPLRVMDGAYMQRDVHYGCEYLRDRMLAIEPKLHIFGHVHSGRGRQRIRATEYYNVACCDEKYHPGGAPVVIDVDEKCNVTNFKLEPHVPGDGPSKKSGILWE